MKKLMFVAAFVACAVQAQAASYTATIVFGQYEGYSVWTVNCWNKDRPKFFSELAPSQGMFSEKNFGDELETAASKGDYAAQLDLLNNYAKGTATVGDFTKISNSMPELKNISVDTLGKAYITSGDGNQMYSWLFVLVSGLTEDGDATYGTKYAVVQAKEVNPGVYDPGDYTVSDSNVIVLTSGTVAIPEPTSGLLLLLGMAGLALKRKRA